MTAKMWVHVTHLESEVRPLITRIELTGLPGAERNLKVLHPLVFLPLLL